MKRYAIGFVVLLILSLPILGGISLSTAYHANLSGGGGGQSLYNAPPPSLYTACSFSNFASDPIGSMQKCINAVTNSISLSNPLDALQVLNDFEALLKNMANYIGGVRYVIFGHTVKIPGTGPISGILSSMGNIIGGVADTVRSLVKLPAEILNTIYGTINNLISSIKKVFNTIARVIRTFGNDVTSIPSSIVHSIIDPIRSTITKAFGG